MHTATKQLVQIFPELRVAPLYIAGESYAGKYVPALGMEIHKHKNVPGGDINLKVKCLGFLIINHRGYFNNCNGQIGFTT